MSDKIPNGWRKIKLKEIFNIKNGKTDTVDAVADGEYPLFDRSAVVKRSDKFLFDCEAIILPGEGKEFTPRYFKGKFDLHQRAYALSAKTNGVSTKFMSYAIDYHKNILFLHAVGSTVKSLRMGIIEDMEFVIPPKHEQDKISQVLTNTDKVITETENIIKESERIKKGLMQQLFNDKNNGAKYTKIAIEEIAHVKRGASPRPIADPKWWSDSGVGWIRIEDVTKANKYLKKTRQYLSEAGINNSVPVKKGELIMSICGSIGKPVILDMEACIHDGFVAFKDIKDEIDVEYFYYLLKYLEPVFSGMGQHGTQKNLNSTLVGKRKIPFPDMEEQKKIAQMFSSLDMKISVENNKRRRLVRLKKGLMQKLLTGQIRVNVGVEE